jgi:hypothetical protein
VTSPVAARHRDRGAQAARCALWAVGTLGVLGGALGACSDRDRPAVRPDVRRPHRVIEPPSGTVRSLAPYAIRADGVGPYLLGAPLASLLDPAAPRIALFDIPPVVQVSLVRAEDGGVLIGGDPVGPATFVAVLRQEVGATDSGIRVGSTRGEALAALGPPDAPVDRARDPRLMALTGLRGARVLLAGEKIEALVLGAVEADAREAIGHRPHPAEVATPGRPRAAPTTPPPPPHEGCVRPTPGEGGDPRAVRFGACLSAGGELVDVVGDEVSIRSGEGERPTAAVHVPGLDFAAALRPEPADPAGRDELIVVSRVDEPLQRSWAVAAYRFEPPPPRPRDRGEPPRPMVLTKVADQVVYQLSPDKARWIGAELRDVELHLELVSGSDAIEVGGLLTTHAGGRLHDVAVISPISVSLHRGRSGSGEVVDAGPVEPERTDAGSPAAAGHAAP